MIRLWWSIKSFTIQGCKNEKSDFILNTHNKVPQKAFSYLGLGQWMVMIGENHLHCYSDGTYLFPSGSDGKASARNAGDLGSIPGLGRSPGEGIC